MRRKSNHEKQSTPFRAAQYAEDQRLLHEALIYWGYQRRDIELLCHQKALDPVSFAARLGELWIQNSRERDSEGMPGLPHAGDGVEMRRGRSPAPAAHGDHGAHDDGSLRTSHKKAARPRKAAKNQVKKNVLNTTWSADPVERALKGMKKKPSPAQPNRQRAGWGKLKTKAARMDETIRRMRKRSDPMAKRILKGLLRQKRAAAKAVKAAEPEASDGTAVSA